MNVDSKTLNLIVTLNKLTATDQLKWTVSSPPGALVKGTDDFVPLYIDCVFNGNKIGLFERRYKDYNPEFDGFFWSSQIGLVFVDYSDRVIWEIYDSSSAIYDLFETARRKISKIDQLLANLPSVADI